MKIVFDMERLTDEGVIDNDIDLVAMMEESDELGCWEILNAEYSDGELTLNEGFDIGFATDEVSSYSDYIHGESDLVPMYYTELMRRNDYMDDSSLFNYAGGFVMAVLDVVNWCLENGMYVE